MTSGQVIVSRNKKTAWQKVDENAIVVTPETKKIHILEGVGGRIWDHLEQPKSIADIIGLVVDEFEVEKNKAEEDIKNFIDDLVEKQVIDMKSS